MSRFYRPREERSFFIDVLTNRFYRGELPGDGGSWLPARHAALIDEELFEQVQLMRDRNRRQPRTVRLSARAYSLSGLLQCGECAGPMWVHQNIKGRARIFCRNRAQGLGCVNRGTFLDIYEYQVGEFLSRFVIPDDYQEKLLSIYRRLGDRSAEPDSRRRQLEARLDRIRKSYEWGDKPEAEYVRERRQINAELRQLLPPQGSLGLLDRLALFLADVGEAWAVAGQQNRNRLARQLFDAVVVRDEKVVTVRPRPELRAFFTLNEDARHVGSLSGDPDGIRTHDLHRDRVAC